MNDFADRADELIAAGQTLYRMGLVPATSGNFSARLNDGNIAVTVSGRHKGQLTRQDLMRVTAEGEPIDPQRPSAEAALHTQIYRHFPAVKAVLHPHAMNAIVLGRVSDQFIMLKNYELLKALQGITTHTEVVTIPIFANDQNIPRLATQVEAYLAGNERVFGYIIDGHGFYTWGASVADALRHVEALDYLFACELRLKGMRA